MTQISIFTKVFTKKIVWRNYDSYDHFYEYKRYYLRVERLDSNRFWFQVYFKGYAIISIENTIKQTELEAKNEAEKVFLNHYQSH